MDSEDTLKKEEERLMRAISRGGGLRAGAVKAAPKVAPKPVETPKVTLPASNRSSVSLQRSASARSSLSADEIKKLEHDAQEQERKREEERQILERLDSGHFKKKQFSRDWFDIDFKDTLDDEDDKPSASTNNTNTNGSTERVSAAAPVKSATESKSGSSTATVAPSTSTALTAAPKNSASTPVTVAPKNSTPVSAPTTHVRVASGDHSAHPAVKSSTPTPTPTPTSTPTVTASTATPTSAPQHWATDMDQLINSLATLGTGVTPRHKSPQDIALDTATTTLRALKWHFAAPLPEPRHAELGVWIKSLGADLRQLRALLESSAPHHAAFPYVTCAGLTQSLVTAVLDALALVTAAADRKEISTALLALVDRALDWFEAMGRDSSEVTALRDSTGDALTVLVRHITAVVRRQSELSAAPAVSVSAAPSQLSARQAVVSVVEEAARHAEHISETLKAQPYDLAQFKQQLQLLVAAVKKIDPYLTREGDRESVVQSTKHVLEMAIELQSAPESSPLPVLTAISELLRTLTAALRSQ